MFALQGVRRVGDYVLEHLNTEQPSIYNYFNYYYVSEPRTVLENRQALRAAVRHRFGQDSAAASLAQRPAKWDDPQQQHIASPAFRT